MLRVRGAGWLVVPGIGAFLVLVVGALLVGAVGLGGGGDTDASPADDTPADLSSADTTGEPSTRTTTSSAAPARSASAGTLATPKVAVAASAPYGTPAPIVDELSSRAVLDITAIGFEPNASGTVAQCTAGRCANFFPVTFDANGDARLQYLVQDFLGAGDAQSTCRRDTPPCVVKISGIEASAYVTTVFHDVAPPARTVTLTPGARGLVDGAAVGVAASGFLPGERVQAMLCAAPATSGPARCGTPGPVAPFTIGADGTGATTLLLREGRVGSEGARCHRGSTPCGVVVIGAGSAPPGAVAPFVFASGPGARYDRARVVIGLTVALVLLALAYLLARTTDWRKPTEADTPELDRAALFD